MVGACSVCICFYYLLQVSNLLVFFGHVLVFCPGTCVSCLMFFCRPINHSFNHSFIHSYAELRAIYSAARAVAKTLKFHHITPLLKSLQGLKLNEKMK